MRVSDHIKCSEFPCADVRHECYVMPSLDVNPADVSVILISEAAPADAGDYYYAEGNPLFEQTTVQAFRDAGVEVSSIRDILDLVLFHITDLEFLGEMDMVGPLWLSKYVLSHLRSQRSWIAGSGLTTSFATGERECCGSRKRTGGVQPLLKPWVST